MQMSRDRELDPEVLVTANLENEWRSHDTQKGRWLNGG
jgi:hypothetical protein